MSASPSASASSSDDEPIEARRRLIVLAEDDPSLRALLALALELDGHLVVCAASGTELVREVEDIVHRGQRGGHLDLVISDIRMPGMDGPTALRTIRHSGIQAPAILITAFGDRSDNAAKAPDALILSKPIELRQLREIVNDTLGK